MQLVKQIIVTSIGELNQIAQKAHLLFGDEPTKQINIIVGSDGKCEVESIAPITEWSNEAIESTHKMD